MSVIGQRYSVSKRVRESFFNGSLPSWLSDVSSGGSLSFTSDFGGRVELNSGTEAEGDYAAIATDPLNIDSNDTFDAVAVHVTYSHEDGSTSDTSDDVRTSLGFEADGESDAIRHQMNHETSDRVNTISTNDGSWHTTPTRAALYIGSKQIQSSLVYDGNADVVIHRVQDAFGNLVEQNIPDTTANNYRVEVRCETQDTNTDRQFNLSELTVEYLTRDGGY